MDRLVQLEERYVDTSNEGAGTTFGHNDRVLLEREGYWDQEDLKAIKETEETPVHR